MSSDLEGFENLGNFCEDDFEDSWEKVEGKEAYNPDRYQQREFIASGAQKNVFKVYDCKMKRHIALAELHDDIPEEDYEVFFEEASLTASLRHPNIVTVYDYGFTETYLPYFTMELKIGETLADVIHKQEKNLDELLDIFIKVCDAIAYSHSQEIVHLDLKPANIQVGQYGEVQVCDWGLSRKIDHLKTGKGLKGTPGYMAPEQTIEGKILDSRTDIYALGGILYAILTNDSPIEGGLNTVLNATLHNEVVPPSERCPDKNIPESLDAVVNKALAWNKDERYQSVENFKNELTKYLQGHSTLAEKAGVFKELSLFIKRNKQVCLLSFISGVALMLVTLVFIFEIQKSKAETEKALVDLKDAHLQLQDSREHEKKLFKQKEKAFEMYKTAAEERQIYSSQLVGQQLNHAHELMVYPLYFGSPIENLEKSYKILKSHYNKNTSHQKVTDLIVLNLFISQRFKLLQNYESDNYRSLIRIADKYKDYERSVSKEKFLDKDFIHILRDINALPASEQEIKQEVMERLICYSLDAKGVKTVHGKLLEELMKCWNTDWAGDHFSYRKSDLVVRISGEKLITLKGKGMYSSNLSFLRLLEINKLDLRGSGISSLSQIDGAYVKIVDIRHTDIINLHPHNATKRIEEVHLNSGQFDPDGQFKIPKAVRLVYKD
ncbi:MAG: serine/threonine protein kinase [Lentisphaerales bacterium]|nr:serine/threonine protein kinase [Lentisphaerales bacterium]